VIIRLLGLSADMGYNLKVKKMLKSVRLLVKGYTQRPGLYAVGIFANVLPTTVAKFIIKSSLFVLKFKDAGQAKTEDWLCF